MTETKKILVVDDSATLRKIIRDELTEGDFEIIEAEDGEKALQYMENHDAPDLITLDMDMPVLDGFSTCKKLQEKKYAQFFPKHKDRRVPVIFVTANDNLNDRIKGFELGATDFITKPFARGDILAIVKKILQPESHLKDMTVLVADDSSIARIVVKRVLESEGVNVIDAENGVKAFEIIRNKMEEIDTLLLDLHMPIMNGDELCKKVRKELNLIDIPIIFLTATSEHDELLDLFKAGGTDYIVKPFVKEELLARITVHLERAQLTKRLRKTVDSLTLANEEIRILSLTDPLTGCFNRAYMNTQLANEIVRVKRYKHNLSLLLCDLDHFKVVNDTYGHQAGDLVLKTFVRSISDSIRTKIDWIIRYGGEEFMIVLPETDIEGASIIAERLREKVAQTTVVFNNEEIQVTASFGGVGVNAATPEGFITVKNLVNRADQLLYQSKQEGRNRVTAMLLK